MASFGTIRAGRALPFAMQTTTTGLRVAAHTLGCKLNYAETSAIAAQFAERGYSVVPFGQNADVLLLNTCSVTENAEKECRQLVRRALRKSPETFVIVTGCYAQLRPEEIASIEGVDLVLGAKEKFEIFDHFTTHDKGNGPRIFAGEIEDTTDFHSASSAGEGRTRAFLKVQDGCDYTCSFCTIPKARGASRSAEISDIVAQAKRLCADGFHEIILSGVNVGDFGRKSGASFHELLLALEAESEITARIRISSIEPNLLTDEIIELVAQSKKFCPHFHIPLQSGSPRILRMMQRRYQPDLYQSRVEKIKSLLPHAGIGADVIAGFPGETDSDFRESYDFIHSLDVSYLHVFTYSERPGTKAASSSSQVPVHVRRERNRMLRILSEKKKRSFLESHVGSTSNVILELGMTEGFREGFSDNYTRVRLTSEVPVASELVRVQFTGVSGDVMLGEPLAVLARRREELLPIL
jgi:threonylcarbamoyladenosine tRNA methylthiotransferase MtaB